MNNGTHSATDSAVPFFSRFQTRLTLLVLLVCVPALVLTVYTNFSQRETEKVRAKENTIALSRLAAAREENFVKNTRQLLATVSQVPFLAYGTKRRICEMHFINLRKLSPDYVDFGLIEANGTLFCSAAMTNGSPDLSDSVLFQRVLQTKRFSIGNYQPKSLTGSPTLDFGYPIFNERGELHRVLYGSLDLALMSKVASDVRLPSEAALTVLDRDGNVLARHPDAAAWIGKQLAHESFVQTILRGSTEVFEMRGSSDFAQLFAATPISDGYEQSLFVSINVPTRAVFADANRSLIKNVVILGTITALVLLLGHIYARQSLIQPLQSLVSTARQLASGRLDARARVPRGTGELAELAHTFDEMAATLERRQKEIEAANAQVTLMNLELEQRVNDRTAQLIEANRELEAFSYSVSHDLRAPLRHIDGFAELLRQSPDVTMGDQGLRHFDVLTRSAKRMGRLIDDLLKFSRMGRDSLRIYECDMNQLVQDAIHEVTLGAPGRSIEWNIAPLVTVQADRNMLKLVWVNLLSNAVKYTRDRNPAQVAIGCTQRDKEYEFFIRDNGVGFDMRYVDKLFGVFHRLHSENEFEGTGIGLANVRRIVERHGGRTWAEAKVGHGATFYFTLPLAVKVPSCG